MEQKKLKLRAWNGSVFYEPIIDQYGYVFRSERDFEDAYHYPDPVTQFVWLYDCDGKELYQGDIVETTRTKDQFFPQTGSSTYVERRLIDFGITDESVEIHLPKSISYSERHVESHLKWKLIGNIFENPDLMEKPGYKP